MGNGQPSYQRDIYTFKAAATLVAKRQTALGLLNTSLSTQWLKASNDGTDAGTATVTELKASLAGGTVGYTYSLMNFWWRTSCSWRPPRTALPGSSPTNTALSTA